MAININTTRALRGMSDLQQLVKAIVAAEEHDEADWVEWKSTLDLAKKEGCFPAARAILGMANRLPERAAVTCEGLGYVIGGAEPGSVMGVESVDPAALDQIIEQYLGGSAGPRWTPTYIPIQDMTVLVVTVEAPRPGDPIFTLRRQFTNHRHTALSGTVFIRKQGRTVPAEAADHDGLQGRLLAAAHSGAALEVSVLGNVPLSWIDLPAAQAAIQALISGRRDELVAAAEAVERQRNAPAAPEARTEGTGHGSAHVLGAQAAQYQALMRGISSTLSAMQATGVLAEEDKRTLAEYVAQVDDWRGRLDEAMITALPGRYFSAKHGVVALKVRNPTGRFLTDIEVVATFEVEEATGSHRKPDGEDLPKPPRAYGARGPSPLMAYGVAPYLPSALIGPVPGLQGRGRRTWVEEGSIHIRFGVGDLRQYEDDTSDEVYVLLGARPGDGILRGTWRATIRDPNDVLTGTLEVQVAEEPVDVIALLEAEPDNES